MKLKFAFVTLMVAFACVTFAQNSKKSTVAPQRLGVGVGIGVLTNTDAALQPSGYSSGLNITYGLRARWFMESGVLYNNRSQAIATTGINKDEAPKTENKDKAVLNYRYLDVPVKMGYVMYNNRKYKLYASGGLAANYMMQNGTTNGIANPNTFGLSYMASMGGEVSLTDRLRLRFEPLYRQALIINANSKNMDNFGLQTGVQYNLGR